MAIFIRPFKGAQAKLMTCRGAIVSTSREDGDPFPWIEVDLGDFLNPPEIPLYDLDEDGALKATGFHVPAFGLMPPPPPPLSWCVIAVDELAKLNERRKVRKDPPKRHGPAKRLRW